MRTQLTEIIMPTLEKHYPCLAAWVLDGWLEVGYTDGSGSFIRLQDEGGVVWEGKLSYPSLDAALQDAEGAAQAWLDEHRRGT